MLFSAWLCSLCWDEQIWYSLYWWANHTILLQPFKLPMDLYPLQGWKVDSTSKIHKNCSCCRNPFLYLLFFACSLHHHCLGFAIHLLTQLQPWLWTVVISWNLTSKKKKKNQPSSHSNIFSLENSYSVLGLWILVFVPLHELLIKLGEKGKRNKLPWMGWEQSGVPVQHCLWDKHPPGEEEKTN